MNDVKVKEAIKHAIAGGMKLTRCCICGETWFIPANDAIVLNDSFVCNRCLIKMQRKEIKDELRSDERDVDRRS